MSYFFNEHLKDDSCIILGDTNGSVFIITFNPVDRGPFKQQPDCDVFEIHYENALKVCLLEHRHSSPNFLYIFYAFSR